MLTSIKRILKSGWQGFFRESGVALATVFILVLAIGLFSSLFLFKEVGLFLISLLEEKADISVYFKEEMPETEILEIKEKLAKMPEVKEIKYVSREKALADFIQRHKENKVLITSLEEIGRNPFLASLNILAFENAQYQKISNFFEDLQLKNLVEKVDYYQRKPVVQRIFSLTATLNRVFLLLSITLALAAILITFNTIRLAIYNFREEIKIQRLVGASRWFIRGPFLVQGAISGIFAALICFFIFSLVIWALSPKIEIFLPGLKVSQIFLTNLQKIILIQFASGIFLGVISSFLATRRYLKV